MQIKYFSIFLVGFFIISNSNCSYGLSNSYFSQLETKHNLNRASANPDSNNQDEFVPSYKIFLGNHCIRKKRCYVYLILEKKYFNKKDLTSLVNYLKLLNKKRDLLRIAIFDNVKVVKDYFEGKREWREIDTDTKGIYSFDLKEEFLKAKLNDSSEWEMIFHNKFEMVK
jgi:hypothetical protein